MKRCNLETLSKICTSQTVFGLLITCLILWFYILPEAYQGVVDRFEISSIQMNGFTSDYRTILIDISQRSEESKMEFAKIELTAGLFENVSLYALVLCFQIFVLFRIAPKGGFFRLTFSLSNWGFVVDIIQSSGIIFLMGTMKAFDFSAYFIQLFCILKILIYALAILRILIIWQSFKSLNAVHQE